MNRSHALPAGRHAHAGFSMLEALVALALAAFGALTILAAQTHLRQSASVARERGEALRIAQAAIEAARGFTDLGMYASLAGTAPTALAGGAVATTEYTLTQRVADAAGDGDGRVTPRHKTLAVDVGWTDRRGLSRSLTLVTAVAGIDPALAGSLAIAADRAPTRRPSDRHLAVPAGAVAWDVDGHVNRSRFDLADGSGVGWLFDDATGAIVARCGGAEGGCEPFDARLLAGHVRFATLAAPPTAADAERPTGEALPVEVRVTPSSPSGDVVECHERPIDAATVAYWCAVPVGAAGTWSGRADLVGLPLAADPASDADPARVRVCRYTPTGAPDTVGAGLRNDQHPAAYVDVSGPLLAQNFLVVRAGDGSAPYTCPPDGPGSDDVDTHTRLHQPPG